MTLIQLVILLLSFLILDARYSLYHSDDRYPFNATFDCLYAYLSDYTIDQDIQHLTNYNLVPYCRRLDQREEQEKVIPIQSSKNVENQISFTDLYRQGVTSAQLLDWLAPIDIAEEYEKSGEDSNRIFYNCSLPWFGSVCQYRFDYTTTLLFSDLVQTIFSRRFTALYQPEIMAGTCYPFLTSCHRGLTSMCLDWREICDGNFDCIHGEDEQLCQLIEVNECSENKYRCHSGGQCIPSAFVRDGENSFDCLDGSDEKYVYDKNPVSRSKCVNRPTFRCEESKSWRPAYFACGDGESFNELLPHFRHSCDNYRGKYMTSQIFNSLNYISNEHCRQILFCLLRLGVLDYQPQTDNMSFCKTLVNRCSSNWFAWPEYPILYGFFQFVYSTNRSMADFKQNLMPDYICFNRSHCPALAFCTEDINITNGYNCCRTDTLINTTLKNWRDLYTNLKHLILRCSTIGTDQTCSHSSLFHCAQSSKCISKHRLVDGEQDCYHWEDELFPACQLNQSGRFNCTSEPTKCLSLIALGDERKDCPDGDDELNQYQNYLLTGNIPFDLFCDGNRDIQTTNTSNETDETHCDWWPCINPYFQCDQAWHCLNGADELNCPNAKCSVNEHPCTTVNGARYYCIPVFQLIEKYSNWSSSSVFRHIYLNNHTRQNLPDYFRWNETKCITSEHILSYEPLLPTVNEDICLISSKIPPAHWIPAIIMGDTDDSIFCSLHSTSYNGRNSKRFLKTSRLTYFPPVSTNTLVNQTYAQLNSRTIKNTPLYDSNWYCHRGILLLRYENNQTKTCLCPPSYFGNRCQWQNQRISLTFQLVYRMSTYSISVFQVVIILIDEQRQIGSYHEQITYVPTRDCDIKFNVYLLYPDQPKNSTTNYSIHIDIYDKITLNYWASWHLSIPFQFLPINRIATQLFIPDSQETESCSLSCGDHGKCTRYINKQFSFFCRCARGYSGLQCEIQHICPCSSDALCYTSSICICPIHQYGSRCYLKYLVDQLGNNTCENHGLYVPDDDRINRGKYTCLCKEGYHGQRCENTQNRIDIQLNEEILAGTTAMFLHYITAFETKHHQRTTTLKRIKYNENHLTFFVTQAYHLLIVELLNKNYYLIVSRERFIESEYIQSQLTSNQRCISIHELINHTTLQSYSRLHRIKYYPRLCREDSQLMCFYDENYICICDGDRFSNCLLFDHSTTYDCQGKNDCENGGQCFQDNVTCPSLSVCVCPDCYYGPKCQLSTRGFVLSLDYILGYHIKPKLSFSRQPTIVKISVALTIAIFIFGLTSAILSILTFRTKKIRDTGCGIYLVVSSWISVLTVSALMMKIWQLIFSQMGILINRSWLTLNCLLLDMILQVLLASNDWLDGCVSIERVVTVLKTVNFNKTKSKQLAKWISFSIILLTLSTHLHDSLHRHLIDDIDIDEQRTWCIVQYSSTMNNLNSFLTLFHFLVPFSINLSSILFIMIIMARSRVSLQPRLTFHEHLQLQFKQHKHHLITSCALVLLALPRLIISFISGCMKSPNNSWLFLFAYLISFLPSIMTFIVFFLPSKMYKEEFNSVVRQTIRRVRTRISN